MRNRVVERARLTDPRTATPPVKLMNVQRPNGGVMSFISVNARSNEPNDGTARDRPRPIAGVALGAFEIAAMIENILKTKLNLTGLDMYVFDPDGPPANRLIDWHSTLGNPAHDTLGHPVGDRLICEVADRMRAEVRDVDTLTRLGGDEFAIAQCGADQPDCAEALARRLLDAVSRPYEIGVHHVEVGVSIGTTLAGHNDLEADQLLRRADMALYAAKREGRGTWSWFEPAMEHDALLRRGWRHPERGIMLPGDFL
jgi:diguanylate cyclase (GGDEF)-like protein